MARFVDAIDVPVSIDHAFAYLADFENVADWDPGVVEAHRLSTNVGVGTEFEVVASFLGQRIPLVYRITAYDAPHRFVLEGGNDTLESVDEITFTPREGGTRITYEAKLRLKGLRALADPLLELAFQVIGRQAAAGLRRALESGAGATPHPLGSYERAS